MERDADVGRVSFRQIIALVRGGAFARVGFSLLTAGLAALVMPPAPLVIWLAVLLVWEAGLRWTLEEHLAQRRATFSDAQGFVRIAAINFFGACIYAALPFLLWSAPTPVSMMLATAWLGGSAVHLFVYFSNHRAVLLANGVPTLMAAIVAPLAGAGFSLSGVCGVIASGGLIAAASLFIVDRNELLKKLAEQIAARRVAEESAAAKGQFLAIMSHELRTPLNAVIGYSELLQDDLKRIDAREQVEDARRIGVSARNLLALINDILDMSSLEFGDARIRVAQTDIAELVRDVAADVTGTAAANRNVVDIAVQPGLRHVLADGVKLRQCLLNLAANACKFTQDGRVLISASRTDDGDASSLVLKVADTGPGIAPEMIEAMFQPFTQGDGTMSRRFGGSGLGLAITRRLARLMGGDVACESELGRGTVFTLTAPLARAPAQDRADEIVSARPQAEAKRA